MLLLLIPGIYLSIAYRLAIPLVVERGLSPWQALEASRKAISQHWFKVFGLFFVLMLIMLLSMIPLGIGLIWTLPLIDRDHGRVVSHHLRRAATLQLIAGGPRGPLVLPPVAG